MRGGPKRQTARVLIIQHNTQHTRQRWPALNGVRSIHATLWRLGLNYSSESRGENAKHIFEYLYAFVWVHWNNKIIFIVVCVWVRRWEPCRYQILHSDARYGVIWGATRLCLVLYKRNCWVFLYKQTVPSDRHSPTSLSNQPLQRCGNKIAFVHAHNMPKTRQTHRPNIIWENAMQN